MKVLIFLLLPAFCTGQSMTLIGKSKCFYFSGYVFPLDALKIDTLSGKIKFSSTSQISSQQSNWNQCTSIKRQEGTPFVSCGSIVAFYDSFCTASSGSTTPTAITGDMSICRRAGMGLLENVTSGGTWSSDNALVSIGNTTGIMQSTGTASGTANITYTTTNWIVTAQVTVTSVSQGVGVHTITGASDICVAAVNHYAISPSAVTSSWVSSNTSFITISNINNGAGTADGTGVAVGTAYIKTLIVSNSCMIVVQQKVTCP